MKYVKMNAVHPNRRPLTDNRPYTFDSTPGFVEGRGAGAQYRWSGDAIKECCKKHKISYAKFHTMALQKASNYGTSTPSYQSIVGYINGRIYKAQAKFENLDEAKLYASTQRPYDGISRKTGKPWEVTIEKRENLMTGETIYMVLTPEYHRWCPKQDIHKFCAEVMDDLNNNDEGWWRMTGRKAKAQSKRKAS